MTVLRSLPAIALVAEVLFGAAGAWHIEAQRFEQSRVGLTTDATASSELPKVDRRHFESRTLWLEGGIAGGTITLIYGMLFYFDAHSRPNGPSILRLPAAAAISFLVGFGPGAFLGGLIPKKDTVTEPVGEGEICPEG